MLLLDSPTPSALCKFACLDAALLKAFFFPPHQSGAPPAQGTVSSLRHRALWEQRAVSPPSDWASTGVRSSVSSLRLGAH